MDINIIKSYMRVDYDEDDQLIGALMLAAKTYLSNAGAKERANNELYNVVLMMLTTFFYENRSADATAIPGTINNLITQLSCSN